MFKKFLSENKKVQWDGYPEIGWWEDNDPLILYHGTHKNNLKSVLENGLDRKDPDTGMISLAFEPNTALGYASMYGGEAGFRKSGSKAAHVPVEDRIVFKFEIPRSWLDKYYDANLSGNMSKEKNRLTDKLEYMKWLEKDTDNDQGYYQLAELRVKEKVPTKFIVGYMSKKNTV